MRRTCPLSVPLVVAALLVACSKETPPPSTTEASAAPDTAAAAAPARPPFPNMATAAWGASVMAERVKTADTSGALTSHLSSALQALHALDAAAATSLQRSAASIYATAEVDGDKGLGASLLAVGLVLDESPLGYKERLTDAHGLAAYGGTLEGGTAVAQAARVFVAVSAGRVYEGEKLLDVMSTSSRIDPDSALLLALARFTMGQRGDELLKQAREALAGKPESARARSLLARVHLDLGLPGETLRILDEGKGALGDKALEPSFVLLRGLALLALGQSAASEALLEKPLAAASDVQRGEAHYRLGTLYAAAGDVEKANGHHARLASLDGFRAEAALLGARIALASGDAAKAKAQALEVCAARGVAFAVAYDCLWAATEACAAAGDDKCVVEWGRKAVGGDDDFARFAKARGQLDDAHLLSPFDDALGKQVKLPVARGGEEVARVLRGARRAIAFGARGAADSALEKAVQREPTCRVCRAVYALAAGHPDEAAKRAVSAVAGKGPPLAERDLLAVIDALGGSPLEEATAALGKLEKDPRANVREAVATAKKDQRNPDARAARKAKEAEATTPAPGTVPVPGAGHPGHPGHPGHHDH